MNEQEPQTAEQWNELYEQNEPTKQWNALYQLFLLYLHMAAWGTPDYENTNADDQAIFRELVESDRLYDFVEETKHMVLRSGLQIPDRWLWPICAVEICERRQLNAGMRNELMQITSEILTRLPRLHPDAQPKLKRTDPQRNAPIQVLLDVADAEVLRLAADATLSGEERMIAILRVDQRYDAKFSTWWAELLGVKDATIRGYSVWKSIQAGRRNPDR